MRVALGVLARREGEPYLEAALSILRPCFEGTQVLYDENGTAADASARRNRLIEAAERGGFDGLFMLDADECMFPADIASVRALMEDSTLVLLPRVNLVRDMDHHDPTTYPDWQARVIRLGHGYRYRNRIHEALFLGDEVSSALDAGHGTHSPSTPIYHYGRLRDARSNFLHFHNYNLMSQGLEPLDRLPEGFVVARDTVFWDEIAPYDLPHPLRDKVDIPYLDEAPCTAPGPATALVPVVPHDPVSIVVLTHDNLSDTAACFEALRETTIDYELLVVDNASSDGTVGYLQELERTGRARVICNVENRGFAAACNQGVAAASHQLVCLLNNDTIPRPGWLNALVGACGEGVGAVGAKLLYPDGRIQHAGIAFEPAADRDGVLLPEHRLRYADGDAPDANVLEDVPAVTGACLLTSRTVWDRVGGLDEGYARVYYEDIDYCLKVREAGLRVVYQPEAVLVHKEQGTVGRLVGGADDTACYFRDNQARFVQRWNDKLAAGLAETGIPSP